MKMTSSFAVGRAYVRLADRDDRVCAHGSAFEPQTRNVWGALASQGGAMLDVGAYTGLYAIAAVLHGCAAVAYEPLPGNLERLRANAKLNGVEFRVIAAAASDRIGTARMTYNATVPLTSGGSIAEVKGAHDTETTVETTTIDALDLVQCTAIKLDVEGAEAVALRGARRTILRCRPMLIIETLDEPSRAAVREELGNGYAFVDVLDGRNWLMRPC